MDHLIKETCSCEYCTMIDIMFGDPTLSQWEQDFVTSVGRFGGIANYTPKQKAVILRLYKKQSLLWRDEHEKLFRSKKS